MNNVVGFDQFLIVRNIVTGGLITQVKVVVSFETFQEASHLRFVLTIIKYEVTLIMFIA